VDVPPWLIAMFAAAIVALFGALMALTARSYNDMKSDRDFYKENHFKSVEVNAKLAENNAIAIELLRRQNERA